MIRVSIDPWTYIKLLCLIELNIYCQFYLLNIRAVRYSHSGVYEEKSSGGNNVLSDIKGSYFRSNITNKNNWRTNVFLGKFIPKVLYNLKYKKQRKISKRNLMLVINVTRAIGLRPGRVWVKLREIVLSQYKFDVLIKSSLQFVKFPLQEFTFSEWWNI